MAKLNSYAGDMARVTLKTVRSSNSLHTYFSQAVYESCCWTLHRKWKTTALEETQGYLIVKKEEISLIKTMQVKHFQSVFLPFAAFTEKFADFYREAESLCCPRLQVHHGEAELVRRWPSSPLFVPLLVLHTPCQVSQARSSHRILN